MIIFEYLFLGLVIGGIALLLLTQVILPLIFGTGFFPLFRKASPFKKQVSDAEHELEEKAELVRLETQLQELNRRKAELEKKCSP